MDNDSPGLGEWRLGDLPDRAAAHWGEKAALIAGEHVETHAEFARNVDRVAKGLMALGVEAGDNVAVWMTNRPAWLHLLYAIPKIGACLVPLNTRYRSDDMASTVIDSQARLLVTIDESGPIDYSSLLTASRAEIEAAGYLETIVMHGEPLGGSGAAAAVGWSEMIAQADAVSDEALRDRAEAVSPAQLMMLAYTSGTTGNPKGVMHSHAPIQNMYERAEMLGYGADDIHLNFLPLFHIYAISEIAVMVALTGGAQVLFEVFDGEAALDAMEQHGATVAHGFDSHWGDMLDAQAEHQRDASTLRLGTLPAGMESTTPIARRVQQELCRTVSGFGMSESWAFVCCSSPDHTVEQRTEASGLPMNGIELEVRDPTTRAALPAGTPGQLFIRGYTVTTGYWANPAATAATLADDGWLDTGDMATLRLDGHVVFIGRYKDMLKVGGENMSPAEVEGYLLQLPGVAEVAVVGYPDDRLAEVPIAYVVRTKDRDVELATEQAIIESLRGRVASYKIPRAVLFVDQLPMTPSGKIRKVELRARALTDLA